MARAGDRCGDRELRTPGTLVGRERRRSVSRQELRVVDTFKHMCFRQRMPIFQEQTVHRFYTELESKSVAQPHHQHHHGKVAVAATKMGVPSSASHQSKGPAPLNSAPLASTGEKWSRLWSGGGPRGEPAKEGQRIRDDQSEQKASEQKNSFVLIIYVA